MAEQNTGAQSAAGKQTGTAKYEVLVTCFWNDVFYRVGDIVELPSNATTPKDKDREYFKKL